MGGMVTLSNCVEKQEHFLKHIEGVGGVYELTDHNNP
jgi:hypothetical protein